MSRVCLPVLTSHTDRGLVLARRHHEMSIGAEQGAVHLPRMNELLENMGRHQRVAEGILGLRAQVDPHGLAREQEAQLRVQRKLDEGARDEPARSRPPRLRPRLPPFQQHRDERERSKRHGPAA